jgi:NADH-quinone oxidoreductase subunit E
MFQIVNPQNKEKSHLDLLSDETRSAIDGWLKKYPREQRRSAVLGALHAVQDQNGGWVSAELMAAVSEYIDIPLVWVREAAEFYSMFHTQPVGRHKISICTNISCMLRGADQVVKYAENKLGIKLGETTEDGRITLVKEEECVAACTGAPMMIVDGHYYENLTEQRIDEIMGGLD